MAYSYEFLPDVALADIAYRVSADTIADLFCGAAEALTRVLADASGIEPIRHLKVSIQEESLVEALHEFLSEIVYLKDAQSFVMHEARVTIEETPLFLVSGNLRGDTIDPSRHTLGQDVKAVTYHMFEAGINDTGYFAQVVLDV
jgi:SHS2 domain-containing protein